MTPSPDNSTITVSPATLAELRKALMDGRTGPKARGNRSRQVLAGLLDSPRNTA